MCVFNFSNLAVLVKKIMKNKWKSKGKSKKQKKLPNTWYHKFERKKVTPNE
jgi:hypothetical protein